MCGTANAICSSQSRIFESLRKPQKRFWELRAIPSHAHRITSSQLRTAVDKGHITEDVRVEHDKMAEVALAETTGLMEYLESPEALKKARQIRARRETKRAARTSNREMRTANSEPRIELGTRTKNREPRTEND
jgi:hypothetical protein